MNALDIIILVILLVFAVKGLARGLVNEASSLAGLFLGMWLAYRYYPAVSAPLRSIVHVPANISAFLAFILILIVVGIVAHVIGNLITAALRLVLLGGVNRLGGALLGAAEGVLLLSLLFSTATAGFMPDQIKQKIRKTESAHMLAQTGDKIISAWHGRTSAKP